MRMSLSFKSGVSLKGLEPQMLIALRVVEEEFSKYGLDTVVTSANDSVHSPNSYHYLGRAFDFRTKHAQGIASGIISNIRKVLGPLGFDIIWEDQGGVNEHLHCEWDRRGETIGQ